MTFYFHQYQSKSGELWNHWSVAQKEFPEFERNRILPFIQRSELVQVEPNRWEIHPDNPVKNESLAYYLHCEYGICPNPPYWGISIISHREESELGKLVLNEFPELTIRARNT